MKFSATILAALMGFALLASADVEAARVIDCVKVPSHESCKGSSSQGSRNNDGGMQWEICINGINLQGQSCRGDTWGNWNKPRQITARGRDAMELIRNGKILASNIDSEGQYRLIVAYQGQYRPAQGKTFSCTVSPDARQFECRSWTPTHRNY